VVDRDELEGADDDGDRRAGHDPFPAAHRPIMNCAASGCQTDTVFSQRQLATILVRVKIEPWFSFRTAVHAVLMRGVSAS
jgi:hypothetical protein